MCVAASSPGQAHDLDAKTALEIHLPVPLILGVLHTDKMQPGGRWGGGHKTRTSPTVRNYLKKTNIGINGSVEVGGLEWRTVPVVADSRSEEPTDGQETPFLPPSAAN